MSVEGYEMGWEGWLSVEWGGKDVSRGGEIGKDGCMPEEGV